MTARHIVAIGGSDAGISAALRARELDPTTDVTVVVADAYPNFSICGIPYYDAAAEDARLGKPRPSRPSRADGRSDSRRKSGPHSTA
jgi:NADPH-dependent 2,4-dienoyl-CoA reductase/sulfur reductase-like enzyme